MFLKILPCRFYIVDHNGLISKSRPTLMEMEEQFYDLSSFAVDDPDMEGMSLLDTVKKVESDFNLQTVE